MTATSPDRTAALPPQGQRRAAPGVSRGKPASPSPGDAGPDGGTGSHHPPGAVPGSGPQPPGPAADRAPRQVPGSGAPDRAVAGDLPEGDVSPAGAVHPSRGGAATSTVPAVPPALSGAAFRDAWKAARSARAKQGRVGAQTYVPKAQRPLGGSYAPGGNRREPGKPEGGDAT